MNMSGVTTSSLSLAWSLRNCLRLVDDRGDMDKIENYHGLTERRLKNTIWDDREFSYGHLVPTSRIIGNGVSKVTSLSR